MKLIRVYVYIESFSSAVKFKNARKFFQLNILLQMM